MKKTLRQWLSGLIVLLVGITQGGSIQAATETITYFHNDVAGTPLLATNATGAVVWKEKYRPYGEKLTNAPASAGNRIGFAGKPYDANTRLSYMGARYYDPVYGRFLGVDPREVDPADGHSFNRYAYANNNPYRYVDPDGRHAVPIVLVAATVLYIGATHHLNCPGCKKDGERAGNWNVGRGGGERSVWNNVFNESSNEPGTSQGANDEAEPEREKTPSTHPDNFEPVKGSKGKRDNETGEIWEKDKFHKDHYEVYKDKRNYEKGRRDRDVWEDGRPKRKF